MKRPIISIKQLLQSSLGLGVLCGTIALLLTPFLVFAVNITVPSAPSSGYFLVSTTTGAYIASSTPNFTTGLNLAATSTGSKGINLSGGCFAINGTCVGSGSGTVTAVTGTFPIFSSGGATPNITFGGLSTSTNLVTGELPFSTGINTLGQVATSSISFSSPLSTSGTAGALVGGTSLTVSCPTCTTGGITALGNYATTTGTAISFSTSTQSLQGATFGQSIIMSANSVLFTPVITGTLTAASSTLLANNNFFSGNTTFSASTTMQAQLNLNQASSTFLTTTTLFTPSGTVSVPTVKSAGALVFTAASGVAEFVAGGTSLSWDGTIFQPGSNNAAALGGTSNFWKNIYVTYASSTLGSFSSLTSGDCVQASTGGELVSAAAGCGTGTVTSIVAGTGLSGGTITTSGTVALSVPVSIANGGTATTTGGVTNGVEFYNGSTLTNTANFVTTTTGVGIATTTPAFALDVLSASNQQLGLSDGVLADPQWAFRNSGATLYIGTTSPTTYATSSPSAIQITSNNTTLFGVATTSPWRTLSVTGTVAFNGLSSATGLDSVCINAATKELVDAGGNTCTLSSEYLKHNVNNVNGPTALDTIMQLNPITYVFNGQTQERYGFIAEITNTIDPVMVQHAPVDETIDGHLFKKGDPTGIDYEGYTALLTKAVQQQQQEITSVQGGVGRSVDDNWQWYFIGVLIIWNIWLTIKMKKYAHS